MGIDDYLFANPLGPGGADVILGKRVNHRVTHVTYGGSQTHDGEGDDGQGQMPGPCNGYVSKAFRKRAGHSADGQPSQPYAEQEHKQQSKEKSRYRISNEGTELEPVIKQRTPFGRHFYADGQSQGQVKEIDEDI
jgi:hypothetical protein